MSQPGTGMRRNAVEIMSRVTGQGLGAEARDKNHSATQNELKQKRFTASHVKTGDGGQHTETGVGKCLLEKGFVTER